MPKPRDGIIKVVSPPFALNETKSIGTDGPPNSCCVLKRSIADPRSAMIVFPSGVNTGLEKNAAVLVNFLGALLPSDLTFQI